LASLRKAKQQEAAVLLRCGRGCGRGHFAVIAVLALFALAQVYRLLIGLKLVKSATSVEGEGNVRGFSEIDCVGWDMESYSCMLSNVCYEPVEHQWIFYLNEDASNWLPHTSFVDPRGKVRFGELYTFEIDMRTAYNHIKERDEVHITDAIQALVEKQDYNFRVHQQKRGPLIIGANGTTYLTGTHFLAVRSKHDDNPGHLIFDSYFPVLTASVTFLGGDVEKVLGEVTVIDFVNENRVFSKWRRPMYERWHQHVAPALFKEWVRHQNFFARHSRPGPWENRVCFERLIGGCKGISGLAGEAHHRSNTVDAMRRAIWRLHEERGPPSKSGGGWVEFPLPSLPPQLSPSAGAGNASTVRLNILMLEKNESHWQHNNLITNWPQVVESVRVAAGPHSSVLNIRNPSVLAFSNQVNLLRQADVVISLWGGISMLNFLAPRGAVEIIFSAWFEDIMPIPNTTASAHIELPCPDFDDRARASFGHRVALYCSRDDGMRNTTVDLDNFGAFLGRALDAQRQRKNIQNVKKTKPRRK
jgi:hypothetical protein